ncbi:MAG: TonB-dependent receptor [Muribaculaceae bacterium]|nr:TonB-dependent receptor [Muribaculaceae bacterium]
MRKLFLILMALMACTLGISAQTQTIRGTVVDAANNEPLVGATVMPIGGGQGVATDVDGKFVLTVPSKVKQARVSYVGYIEQTVTLKNGMTVSLSETANNLDEVMVVAYGTAKKSAYTGSASVVKSETIENALVSTATDALAGKLAGVQVQSSNGQPGTSPTIRIRGVGSINANNDPLYILDGVPYDGDISGINTMDIESMTVLKDAAAAALYGARGANGVILITTKKGSSGNAKVTVDARWGSNHRAVSRYDVLETSDEFVETTYQALRNGYYYNGTMSAAAAHAAANANIFGKLGYQVYTVPNGEGLIGINGKVNPNATLGYSDGTYYYQPDDWYKEQLRDGFRQEYNVSVTGGNDRFNYYVSGAYLGDQGLIKGSHFNRLSTRTSMDYQVKPWLKIGTNVSYTYTNSGYPSDNDTDASNSSGNAFLMSDQMPMYYPMYVRNADGSMMYNEQTGLPVYDYGDRKIVPYSRNWMSSSNPAGNLAYDTEDYLADVFNGKWYLLINPIEGLNITGSVGYFLDNTRYHNLGNPFYGQMAAYGGSAVQYTYRTRSINLQGLINYTRTFAEKHDLDVLLGYESYDLNMEMLEGTGNNLYLPDSWVMNNTIDDKHVYGYVNTYATRGLFGRVNYAFDSRYFFSASVRRDASSRFAPGKRWGTFWSLSGAWNIAKEAFMQNSTEWLDQLKLKVSFGQQGNDNLGRGYYPWQDQYTISGADGVWSDGTLYRKGNPDITWETSNNFNVGVDFSFLKGMVYGTLEYFNRQTSDMLYNKPVAPSAGYSSIPMNIGSMRNNGVELELNVRPIATKNVTWDLNFNITGVNNKVLKLHPDLHGQLISGSRIYREGESMYQLYLVKYAGVDPATGLALYWAADYQYDDDGNVVKDKFGNNVIASEYATTDFNTANTTNKQSTGNLMPKAYGGFGTNLQFFGFDFSMAFAYQFGGKIWDYTYQNLMHNGSSYLGQNWHKDIYNAWTPDNRYTNVPRLDAEDQYTNSSSTRWLTSSNYLSLNNVTLGYTLPKSVVNKLRLQNIRVYASGENLFVVTARKGMDPRQGYVNSEGATYKGSRTISGGLRIEF